ncbi:MAG: hypothetical protein JNL38_38235 [Myxococcales bacterium]|nr:hypothetical protein [Myxococcales bacterium]
MRSGRLRIVALATATIISACRSDDERNCAAPTTTWTETSYVKPPVREVPPEFGTTVAMSADGATLAVAAFDRGTEESSAGAVFVYQHEGAGWRHDTTLRPSPPSSAVSFGSSLALSSNGRRLVVTAPYDDSAAPMQPSPSEGSVFVFEREASAWKQSTRLTRAKDDPPWRRLGVSLALSGDGARIAVGIMEGSIRTSRGFGSLRVFDLDSSNGAWMATEVLPPDFGACTCGAHYGAAVALSSDGKTLVVGNLGRVPTATGRSGSVTSAGPGQAWVYRLVDGDWRTLQELRSTSPIDGGEFGDVLAISADGRVIAVNASREDAVHVFREADGHWTESHRLGTPSPVSRDFGGSLAVSSDGSQLVVGMPVEPTTAVGTAGSLCAPTEGASNGLVYAFADEGRSFKAFLRPRVHHRGAAFGLGLAISGDGRTLAVGAPGEDCAALGVDGDQTDHSLPNAGAVYLFKDVRP